MRDVSKSGLAEDVSGPDHAGRYSPFQQELLDLFSGEWGVFIDGEAEPHPCCICIGLGFSSCYAFAKFHEVIEFLPVGLALPVECFEFLELNDAVGCAEFIGFKVVADAVKNEDHVVWGSIYKFTEMSGFSFS